jgi:predicted DNA-binding protein (MmcQ/YjbR family)
MTIEEIKQICETLPGTIQDMKWEDHLCFNVGGKMYLVTLPGSVPHTASFKAGDEEFEKLSVRKGFMPAPYLARHKWVHLDDINRLSKRDWEKYIRNSYQLVYDKLPAKIKKEIGVGN